MNPCKKVIELTGSLICPIRVGEPAFICEATGMRRTSTVLQMESVSAFFRGFTFDIEYVQNGGASV